MTPAMLETRPSTPNAAPPPFALASVREASGGLDDLSVLRDLPVPRPPEICARFAGRVSPWWGFVVYGVLWLFLSMTMFTVGMLPLLLLAAAIGAKGAAWAATGAMITGGALFVMTWVWFARWVKRRRASAGPLVRDGEIIEGRVFDRWSGSLLDKAVRFAVDYARSRVAGRTFQIEVAHGDATYMVRVPTPIFGAPAAGTRMPVLFTPASSLALVFDKHGKSSVVRAARRRRR